MAQDKIYSVTEITREIKRVIRDGFGVLWVEGEISGYKHHSSGHHYFTLKDAGAQLSCVMWRGSAARLNFRPADGVAVQAWGNLDVYESSGRYQLIVTLLRPTGIGDLQRAFEALKVRLKADGLFALERKRELPAYPERVGVVTSADGAAWHDMHTVAMRRWPAAELRLAPVAVQGTGAAAEIAAAISKFSEDDWAEVIVTGRGGGSLEDLWAFNEEVVARAIFNSRIPVVSAVGHEVDFTIADFVADVRAPTPSAAMEILLPDRAEVAETIVGLKLRLARLRTEHLRDLRRRIARLAEHWALRQPVNLVNMAQQRIDEQRLRLSTAFGRLLRERSRSVARVQELLHLFRPQAVLQRGYAIVRDNAGAVVRDADALAMHDRLRIAFARGGVVARVEVTFPENRKHEPPQSEHKIKHG